jgi:hypothetical protein
MAANTNQSPEGWSKDLKSFCERLRAQFPGVEVLYAFKVLKAGWELDNEGAIGKLPSGEVLIFTTSHGGLRWTNDPAELESIIAEHEAATTELHKARKAFGG